MMRIAAVVPAWNASDRLPGVLRALQPQVDAVIVVDNGSTDGTLAILRAWTPPAVVVANADNLGYAAAVNQGLRCALDRGAEAVLLANDDAEFADDSVAALAWALEHDPSLGAVSAHMVYRDRPGILNGAGGAFDRDRGWADLRGAGEADIGQYEQRPVVAYPSGAACLIRGEALEDVGLMDEAYYLYFEDADWGLRARLAGWTIRYVAGARVVHVGSAGTADDPARRRYYNVRNRLRLARSYAGTRGRAHAWAATLVLLLKQPARWLTPRRRRDAQAVWYGVADYVRGRFGRSTRFG